MSDPERPRERLTTYGGDRLATEDLLALVLGTGTRGRPAAQVGRDLLAHAGGLAELARAAPGELTAVPGVGAARAARLAAAFHLGRRALEAAGNLPSVLGPEQVFLRLRPRLDGLRQEVFLLLALDIRMCVLAELEIARGCLTGVEVHPREVFRPLIRLAAASCVVVHNHPSGDPRPSPEDLALTERLREVGDLVGIPLVDHIIVAGAGYVSLAERSWGRP